MSFEFPLTVELACDLGHLRPATQGYLRPTTFHDEPLAFLQTPTSLLLLFALELTISAPLGRFNY